jgi:hypothetical protein
LWVGPSHHAPSIRLSHPVFRQAQTAYHLVLETYGTNYRLVRLYGKFLETVKNDPWGALEYYTEADRLEQEKNDDGAGPLLPDGEKGAVARRCRGPLCRTGLGTRAVRPVRQCTMRASDEEKRNADALLMSCGALA